MSQKIKTSVEIDGSLSASQIANATTDTDKFLVSDGGTIKYRTGAELATDLGISAGVTSKVQHQVKAGVAINKGQAVYVTGADGTNMIVGLASNATEATSSKTMGLLNATVSANGFADVITEGLLDGLDTSTAVVGNPVWLGTGGNLIYGLANKPYAPAHLVFIGIVTRVNANNGEIFVKVQNGFELDEIHDIDLKTTTPINGHLLGYNGTLWVNKTIAGWLGYTPQAQLNGTGFVKASGTTITYDNTSYYPASNPNGYISTYTETDTLASVTSRGSITTNPITINSTSLQHLTLNNRFNLVGSSNFHITNNAYYNSGFKYKFAEVASKIALNSDNSFVFQTAPIGVVDATITFENKFWADSAGNALSTGSMRSPIFYDYDNTGYYIDPSSQSNLYTVYANSYNLYNGNTIWNSGNDGSGSGLDADLLDGQQATSFAKQAYVNVGYDFNTLAAENSDSGIVYRLESSVINPPTGGIYNWSLWQQGNSTRGSQIAVGAYGGNEIYFRGANADTGSYRGWQRVLHDGNYSSYAVPTSRTITINGTSYDLSANRSWTVSAAETDTLATVVARGNTANSSIAVRNSISINKSDGSSGGQLAYDSAINQLYLWNSLSSGYFSVYTNNAERLNISSGGAVTANVDMRAPIFYDSNNTGYYVDPSTISYLSSLRISDASSGASLIVGTNDTSRIYSDNPRKQLAVNADYYPCIYVNALSNNGNTTHGAVISMSGNLNSGGYRRWGMGIANTNPGVFSIGYADNNSNPHYGVGGSGWSQFWIGTGGDVYATDSFRSPIFYDSNDTGYYVDPASTSNLNVLSMANKIILGSFPNSTTNNGEAWIGRAADRSAGTMTVQLGGNLDRKFEVVDYGWTTVNFSVNGYGAAEASGSMRAPIFYDSNDTTYYLDPASTGTSLNVRGYIRNPSIWINDGDDFNGYNENIRLFNASNGISVIAFGASGTSGTPQSAILGYSDRYEVRVGAGNQWQQRSYDGYTEIYGSSRAPLFYDSNNTGYYVDPASTSNLNDTVHKIIRFAGVGGDSGNGSNPYGYAIYQQGGSWNYPYPDLCIGYHTGIKIGAYYSYNGTRFYNNSDWATITASVNDGDNNFRGYYDVIAYASDRRLKHKVKPIKDALSKVKSLTGMTYQWNEIGKEHGWDPDTEVREAGVFAQDVQAVLPEAVRLAPFDDDHGISRSGESFLTVKYDKIVPLLIEAIKEQQTQIEELKQLVNKLINK